MRRWWTTAVIVAALAAVPPAVVTPSTVAAAGTCVKAPDANGVVIAFYCDHWTTTVGPRGSIALMGDSLFVGASPTVSSPSLPDALAARGWGPIRMTAAVAMRTQPGNGLSGAEVVDDWRRAGVRPDVVAVNIGMAHLTECTPATASACATTIAVLVDKVLATWPSATVWWARIVHHTFPEGVDSVYMRTWNDALDTVARRHPGRMVVWDWPAALAASDIVTDFGDVHPANPTEYTKRSALIADHLTSYTPAKYRGPAVPLPAVRAAGYELVPQRDPAAGALPPVVLAAGVTKAVDVRRALPAATGTGGAVLTVSTTAPSASGRVSVHECGRPSPPAAQLQFSAGATGDSAQAVVPLTTGGTVCLVSTAAVTVQVAVQAGLAADGGRRFSPITPSAATVSATAVPTVLRITHPAFAGAAAAAVSVTVDGPSGGGRVTLRECGRPGSVAPTLEFGPGRPRSAAAVVPVRDGAICATTAYSGAAPRLRVAVDGVFASTTTGARFRFATAVTRLLDMRPAVRRGGWVGRHVAGQRIRVPAAPGTAVALVGRVTADAPLDAGEVLAHPGATSGAPMAAVAFARGLTSSAPLSVAVGAYGTIDLVMRRGNAQTALDVIGWWVR